MTRKIRVTCEVSFVGCDIEDVYYDLPDDWDTMSQEEQGTLLREMAMDTLEHYASCGASVVDENGDEIS